MMIQLERTLGLVLVGLVIVLTLTAATSWGGHAMGGFPLLIHMGVSGAMVFALPIFAIVGLMGLSRRDASSKTYKLGFWGLVTFGMLTIVTVFLCMLPIPSTDQMHQLVSWHGWAGYAMAVAAAILMFGWFRSKAA